MARIYLFDLDGTIYRGEEALPGAVETVAELKRRGALVRYLTNNSGQTRQFFAQKLTQMGFDCSVDEVVGSAYGTAKYCQEHHLQSAFVVGEIGLVETLREEGIAVHNALPNGLPIPQNVDTQPDAVVVGICKQFDYAFLNAAMQRIRSGAKFIATNRDATYPLENDVQIPGAGSIVSAVATAAGQEPFVVGKPNPYLVQMVLGELGIEPEDAVVVGDRYETDILCGHAAGCPTYMVLTGVTKQAPEGQWHGETLAGLLET